MATHTSHEALRTYNPDAILQDGCPECEHRGETMTRAMRHLDPERFARAWQRAAAWQRDHLPTNDRVALAEVPLLEGLWAVQP